MKHKRLPKLLSAVIWLGLGPLSGCSAPPVPASTSSEAGSTVLVPPLAGQPQLLLFTRTAGFRHQSIPAGQEAVKQLAQAHGFGLTATEDHAQFTDDVLAGFSAVIFLSTSGDVLDASEQAAFERYMAAGSHGFVGVHAAADCEYDWSWYGALVGAYFAGHSDVVQATVKLEPVAHPALAGLSTPWSRSDEWYGFRTNPRGSATVLLTVDETTFDPGPGTMGADHPVAWYQQLQGGRSFYTALGHTAESFSEPAFLGHLLGGIQWAAGLATTP